MTVVLTFLLLLFGEVVPKIYGSQRTLTFCRFAAPALVVLERICSPLSWVLIRSKVVTERFVHSEPESLTVDDLEKAMELTDQRDIAQESSMLQGIIRFGGEMAREVMTSRMDIVDLDIRSTFSEVLASIVENNYSRIPVYQDSSDNIRGILYVKDLLPHIGKPSTFRWQSLIRQPYFVPETKKIDDLMREFQKYKVHMAIVVDEFGGTSGLVTLEDILEEIVGEINDEYDEEERYYTRLNVNTYIFEGKTLLSDFYRVLGIDESELEEAAGDADTLAGLMLELKGDFPQIGEKLHSGRFTFQVLETEERRISRVKVIAHDAKE
jgi:gliding motility-associated protein GldE